MEDSFSHSPRTLRIPRYAIRIDKYPSNISSIYQQCASEISRSFRDSIPRRYLSILEDTGRIYSLYKRSFTND